MAELLSLDPYARRAWQGDKELHLTAKEFDLLRILVRDVGKVVTRDRIMTEVWGVEWWGSSKTLDMHISWLRRKLGDDAARPRYITTVRCVGFRFDETAEVTGGPVPLSTGLALTRAVVAELKALVTHAEKRLAELERVAEEVTGG